MPQLQIQLPTELGSGGAGQSRNRTDTRSRPLGSGIEGTDDGSRRVLRWLRCWATAET